VGLVNIHNQGATAIVARGQPDFPTLLLGSGICGIDLLARSSPKVTILISPVMALPLVGQCLVLANSHGNSQKILNFRKLQDLTAKPVSKKQYSRH
jgi:hypothetical protein